MASFMTKRNRKLFLWSALSFISLGGVLMGYTIVQWTVQQFDTEIWLSSTDLFWYMGVDYLFTDINGNHRIGWWSKDDSVAWSDAWAAVIWSVNDNGTLVSWSVQQFDTQMGLAADDEFARWSVKYLFKDSSGNHRLGAGAPYHDNAWTDAWAWFMWSVDSSGQFITGTVKKFDTDLGLIAGDEFGYGWLTYLFKDDAGNHRIAGGVHMRDYGATIIWSVDENSNFVAWSAKTYGREELLEAPYYNNDYYFTKGGVEYLFEDDLWNHWIWWGMERWQVWWWSYAGAWLIFAIDQSGDYISWSSTLFGDELWLVTNDQFGAWWLTYLFEDNTWNHRLGWGSHNKDTVGNNAWAAIIRSISSTGQFISGSFSQLDSDLDLVADDQFGAGWLNYLFEDSFGNHWMWGWSANRGGEWAAIIWSMDNNASFVSWSLQTYGDAELSLGFNDKFANGGMTYLFSTSTGQHWLAAGAWFEDTAWSNAWAAFVWSISWIPSCGDGILSWSETCDDGNDISGDGCSNVCAVEENYACVWEPSICSLSSIGGCEWGEFTWTGESKVCVQLWDIVLNPICNLDFGSFNQQPITQTNTWSMDCEISVRDHKWISPWYVTLDFGDMWPEWAIAGTPDIASANLSMLQSAGTALWLSWSMENPHVTTIDHLYSTSHFDGPTVQNVLQRTITGDQIWIYGTQPSFQLIIPAYTVAATYKGTITATLIEE